MAIDNDHNQVTAVREQKGLKKKHEGTHFMTQETREPCFSICFFKFGGFIWFPDLFHLNK